MKFRLLILSAASLLLAACGSFQVGGSCEAQYREWLAIRGGGFSGTPPCVPTGLVASTERPVEQPVRRDVGYVPPAVFDEIALVEISPGKFCPAKVAQEELKRWLRAGGHPFAGTPRDAAKYFDVPEPVRAILPGKMASPPDEVRTIAAGLVFCTMMWTGDDGRHHPWNMVEVQPGNPAVGTQMAIYKIERGRWRYVFADPRICNNKSLLSVEEIGRN